MKHRPEANTGSALAEADTHPILFLPYMDIIGPDGNLYVTSGATCPADGTNPIPGEPNRCTLGNVKGGRVGDDQAAPRGRLEIGMANTSQIVIGTISSLWRYPVKSMLGEELATADVLVSGLLGGRGYALIDCDTGRVASARNPRKWSGLFDCTAIYVQPPRVGSPLPPVRMTVADGTCVSSAQSDHDDMPTRVFDRAVTLVTSAPPSARLEEFWPHVDGLEPLGEPVANPDQETITALPVGFSSPGGTLFDFAVVHVLTSATLSRLRELYPDGRFEVQRFRPNIVVDLGHEEPGFAENAWLNRVLAIGDDVRLNITVSTPRCVMTILAQRDLPRDTGLLRTAAQHYRVAVGDLSAMACVGVYADVLSPGLIRRGDVVRLE